MARFFIDRPVFAMVIAIVIVILGASRFPTFRSRPIPKWCRRSCRSSRTIAAAIRRIWRRPSRSRSSSNWSGWTACCTSCRRSSNDGALTIDVTFKLGTDIDIATVKTQNNVNVALPTLPPEVQRVGVTVKKVSSAFLMAIGIFANDDRYDSLFLTNYVEINLVNQIGSLPGVGEARLAATEDYGMRVWMNPDKMAKLGLTATDVSRAIQAQNRQNPAGALGQPPTPAGTDFQYPVNASRAAARTASSSPTSFFEREPDGSLLRVRDIGRVELGAQDYNRSAAIGKKPAASSSCTCRRARTRWRRRIG